MRFARSTAAAGLALATAAGLASACRGPAGGPFVVSYDDVVQVSIPYPAGWSTEQATEGGQWYRYFLPPTGSGAGVNPSPVPWGLTPRNGRGSAPKPRGAPVADRTDLSVTLFVGPLAGRDLASYATAYLADKQLESEREARRSGLAGREYRYGDLDGQTGHALLLLDGAERVYGLHARGPRKALADFAPALEVMSSGLRLERAGDWPLRQDSGHGFSLRVPETWPEARRFSGRDRLLVVHTSPLMAQDAGGQPVHASFSLTVERLGPGTTDADAFYNDVRMKLGDSYAVVSHAPWKDGFVDVMKSETTLSGVRVKRYYRVHEGRGYVLSYEAREDVYHRFARWFDRIAGTFELATAGRTR